MIDVIYICGGSDGRITNTCELLDTFSHTIRQLPSMIVKREEHGICIGPDKKVYSVGGFDGKSCLCTAERFDPKIGTWEKIGDMKNARRSLSVVALPDGIYAIGGYDGSKYLSSTERYDIGKDKWVPITPMNKPKCTMAAVSTIDCRYIFVMGGYDGNSLNQVERYDVVHGCWELVCPMKNKRFMHAAVVSSVCGV